jgi:CTP:molybdopterin cytidylyltransferase MocA
VLAALAVSPVDEVVVVEGAHSLDRASVVSTQTRPASLVRCDDWERGPGASLRCGLEALPAQAEAAVVVLADGPDLHPEAVARVVHVWREHDGELVAASYDGVRGHPLVLARTAWSDVPDEGLRAREPRLVPCDDLGAPGDVDRPGDLPERLR